MKALLFFLLAPLAYGVIVPGTGSAKVEHSWVAGAGGLARTGSSEDVGVSSAALGAFHDSQSAPKGDYNVSFLIDVCNTRSILIDHPTFLHVTGSAHSGGRLLCEGGWISGVEILGTIANFYNVGSGNENIQLFEVRDTPENCVLTVNFFGEAANGRVILEKDLGGDLWVPVATAVNSDGDTAYETVVPLPPASYRIRAITSCAIACGEEVNNGYDYDLKVGTDLNIEVPPPGEFSNPGLFTEFTDPSGLEVINPVIVSEVAEAGGLTRFLVRADVLNKTRCPWSAVVLTLRETVEGGPSLTTIHSPPEIEFEANTLASLPEGEHIEVTVASGDAAALRASILDRSRFTIAGHELLVFTHPLSFFDKGDISNWRGTGLQFFQYPSAQVGTIWMQDPSAEPVFFELPGSVGPVRSQEPADLLPVIVSSITADPPSNTYTVNGRQVTLFDVLLHGTLRLTTPAPRLTNGQKVTQDVFSRYALSLGDLLPAPQPVHFNRVRIADLISVSGTFIFDPKSLDFDIRMGSGKLKSFVVSASYGADVHILLETDDVADNSSDSKQAQTKTFFDVPLCSVQLPGGIRFQPRLSLAAGASVSAPSSLTLPLATGMDVTVRAGFDEDGRVLESTMEARPVKISDPHFFENLGSTAKAWIDCEIAFLFSYLDAIETGPTLGVRAVSEFGLAPLADTWWNIENHLDAYVGGEMSVFEVVTIFDEDVVIATRELPSFSSGGPLVDAGMEDAVSQNPGIRSTADPTTRWARFLLSQKDGSSSYSKPFLAPVSGSDDVFTGYTSGNQSVLARISPEGALLWQRDTDALRFKHVDGVSHDDGGIVLLGDKMNQLQLMKINGAGEKEWETAFTVSGVPIWQAISLASDSSGSFVFGKVALAGPTRFYPTLSKLDAAGNLLWHKLCEPIPIGDERNSCFFGDLIIASDGHPVFVGSTGVNSIPVTNEMPDVVETLADFTPNGMVTKLDATDGSLLWAKLIFLKNLPTYNTLAEGPDGSLYLGGNYQSDASQEFPSMLVTKLTSTGGLVDSTLIGHPGGALEQFASLTGLPHGGETPYDEVNAMAWIDDRLWIGGQIGIFNSAAGSLADGGSAFTASLDENLNASRFAIHAGPGTENITDLIDGKNGILTAGMSESFAPWPAGTENESTLDPYSLMLMKLPWEGAFRFHSLSAGAQPDDDAPDPARGTYFIYPRQRSMAAFANLDPRYQNLAQTNATVTGIGDLGLSITDLGFEEMTIDSIVTPAEPIDFKALEYLPKSLIKDQASYLAWHQFAGDSDLDGDGIDAAREFFFGTDPFSNEPSPITFEYLPEGPGIRYTFPRSKLAGNAMPVIQDSPFLQAGDWLDRADTSMFSSPLDPDRDLLELTLPAPEGSGFYRLKFR